MAAKNKKTEGKTKGKTKPRADRATKAELDRRYAFVMEMVGRRYRNGQIKKATAKEFGIAPRTVEGYISRAREELIGAYKPADPSLAAAQSRETYLRVIRDPKSRGTEIVRAQEALDRLEDRVKPIRHEHSGPEGEPIKAEVSTSPLIADPELRAEAEALALRAAALLTEKAAADVEGER